MYAIFCFLIATTGTVKAQNLPMIVFDPGHSYAKPGSISFTGENETQYNDTILSQILGLDWSSFNIKTTRDPGKNISPDLLKQFALDELSFRPKYANALRANLFISLHHDSTQLSYLRKNNSKGYAINEAFKSKHSVGFTIFVSSQNPRYNESLRFAQIVAKKLIAIGRTPSTHHAEDIPNEGYRYLDQPLGIFDSRFLVLRQAEMPAVLIEVGVLPDKDDLELVTRVEFQKAFSQVIKTSIQEFFQMPTTRP